MTTRLTDAAAAELTARANDLLDATGVTTPQPLPGGASRKLWGFEALTPSGPVPLVLLETAGTADREWQALRAAHSAGVPVAEPLWRTADGEGDGIVMRRLTGQTIPRRIFGDPELAGARGTLLDDLAAALAATHGLPLAEVPAITASSASGAVAELDAIAAELHSYDEPHPALELGLRWLRTRVPEPVRPALVHGDYRLGNVVVDHDGLSAVLDWELVHAGDPAEDLGWLCVRSWRFGRDDRPAAGLGTRRHLLATYVAAGGERIGPERLRFWEAVGNLRWGVLCLRQAQTHLSGQRRSLEHAAIGRRTCEAEWDLLAMMS